MKLRGSSSVLLFVALSLAAFSANADGTKSQGCWNCLPDDLTFYSCHAAPNDGYGEGINCTETLVTFFGIPVGQRCLASGGGCYYIDTTGGGGGGGGGGMGSGGSSCTTGGVTPACPPDCFDCGTPLY